MSMMHAATYDAFGKTDDVIKYKQVERPEPKAGEVRVQLLLSPIHNHDLLTIRGKYGYKPALPAIAGSEALGVIDKLGEGVEGPKVGTRVIAAGMPSAWADYFIARASDVVPVPKKLPSELAAQLMSMPLSAMLAFEKLEARQNEWIIINGANGAVGRVIAQIAEAKGVHVASLVNRQGAKDDLEALGIRNVFVVTDDNWKTDLANAIGGARVAGGIDMVSGALAGDMLEAVSEKGVFLSFGNMANTRMTIDPADLIFKEIVVKGFWGLREFERLTPAKLRSMIATLVEMGVASELRLPVAKVYPLSKAAEATAASDSKRNGKIMIAGELAA